MNQNNYINNYLKSIAAQTTRIEEKPDDRKDNKKEKEDKPLPEIEKSFIKPTTIESDTKLIKQPLKINEGSESELIQILKNKLKDTSQPKVSMITLEEIKEEPNDLTLNKLKFSKTPRRPNLISIEKPQTINPHSFDSYSIYEWNIDGLSVGQKMQVIIKMQMYANALRQAGNTELAITKLITSGFTGQLGDWWGTYLTPNQVNLIEQNVKKDE